LVPFEINKNNNAQLSDPETLDAVHVYSPGVAATWHVWPAATTPSETALLLLQLMVLI